ncbi:hypothetical protein [Methylomagnum sp.]
MDSRLEASGDLRDAEQIEAELLNTLIDLVVERAMNNPAVFGEARERLALESSALAVAQLAPRIEALTTTLTSFKERPCGAREVATAVNRLERWLTDRSAAPARQGGCRLQPRPVPAHRELYLAAGLILIVGILAGMLIGQRWAAKAHPAPATTSHSAAGTKQ